MYICEARQSTMRVANHSERIKEIMRLKGITKSELGVKMGVKKQNVNLLLETNNVEKLIGIADALGVSLNDLVGMDQTAPEVKGCIVYKGVVHPINSKEDIQEILNTID